MFSKEAFVDFILKGAAAAAKTVVASTGSLGSALPEGFEEFEVGADAEQTPFDDATFARRLLEAADFGLPELVARDSVIRSTDAVARYLPDRVAYWPKTPSRPYQTLLFESPLKSDALLKIPAFRHTQLHHLNDVEAALARLVSQALDGFQRGGESVTADVRKGRASETLCVVSVADTREGEPVRLVCFGTENASSEGLETFLITEGTRFWDVQLAREHLGLLYERQFKKLAGKDWQEAFTTTEERNQAEKLLDVCTRKAPRVADIQEVVLDLLDTIAKGFGLKKKPNTERRLQAFELPPDHDIGIDPEERAGKFGGHNPFGGVTLRDERSRLLGYIIYPLKAKGDAARLREHLENNNRFHNVLVVYPDQDQASLELWQGRDQLRGKLRQGQQYRDAADVVNLLSRFFVVSKAKVRNPGELAQELAYRARYLRGLAVIELDEEKSKGPLRNLYNAFKEALVHDQSEDEFADAFAQTITYGLLTARWLGSDQLAAAGDRLTRQTALKHLGAGNPFLNDLFKSVLSVRLDDQRGRLLWLVDDIADLLDRIDVQYVFGRGDVGADTATDPVIHFYEPFLAAYDKDMKNKRGVFFTPRPVVSYIVRSVHELLQTEFGLKDGLASTDTWADVSTRIKDVHIPSGVTPSEPFVCILNPATGTGTFLFECIEVIERIVKDRWCRELNKKDKSDPAIVVRWQEYVQKHLLPRLYGYELMMASYAVAHLKLAFKLKETGYELRASDRLNVYLTNSLEPPVDVQPHLEGMSPALAREARAVNKIKRIRRFTAVVGNPPYSVKSFNQNGFIDSLMGDYKKHVKGEQGLVALADDYLKFVRISQELLRTTGCGLWGMITNHGYLRGVIHRGVRKELLDQFGLLLIFDLHGDTNVGETPPSGRSNDNVFDIQQGVSVAICARSATHSDVHVVRHADAWGTRSEKYDDLMRRSPSAEGWNDLHPREPSYFFIPFDETNLEEYNAFVSLTQLMPTNSCGVKTHRDAFLIEFTKSELAARFRDVVSERNLSVLRERYEVKDTPHWRLKDAQAKIAASDVGDHISAITYRPFDDRWIYYNPAIIEKGDSKYPTLRHMLSENIALIAARIQAAGAGNAVFVSRHLVEMKTGEATRSCTVFPLYLVGDDKNAKQRTLSQSGRHPNMNSALLGRIGKRMEASPKGADGAVSPEDVLNYIYAVLYSPAYRKRYSEFLRSDFPRIPLAGESVFVALCKLGGDLVALHLLEAPSLRGLAAGYVGSSQLEIEKVTWSDDTVWLDKSRTHGFRDVSSDVWNFEIGGYQVCEKWLNYRKGRRLSKNEVDHLRKMVVAISETIRIMKKIDEVIDRRGGWPGAFLNEPKGDK